MADLVAGERYATRKAEGERERVAQRILLAVIIALVLVIAGQIVYHLVVAPRLAIETITVHNELSMSDEQVLQIAQTRPGMLFFQADPVAIVERLEAIPEVRHAAVDRLFPNELIISVERRVPLASAVVMTEGGAQQVIFDDDGVVFQIGAPASSMLPVVSGLRFPEAAVGLQLPAVVVDFLTQLRHLQLHNPELFALFSEFRIVPRNEHTFEVVLYPMHFPVPVRTGSEISAEMIQYTIMMLDMLRAQGELPLVEELDLRANDAVVRYRERADG
jgi:cell division protein FtsQ